jgi:predicted  nucleic acid-binding Zn-ribbon protein
MQAVAKRTEVQDPMEQRVTRLEVHVEHIRESIARIEKKIDAKIEPRLDALDAAVVKLREEMKEGFAALGLEISRLHKARWVDKVWWLLISGAQLGVMARGFKWI